MTSTVPTIAARALLEVCADRGLDRTALCAGTGLAGLDLEDRELRIPVEAEEALWGQAMAATGDPALGLFAAERLRDDDYGVLVYLGRHAATVGEAMARVVRWFALVNRQVCLDIVRSEHDVALTMSVLGLPGPLPRAAAEYTLAATLLRMRSATGLPIIPLHVDLPFPMPEDREAQRVFQCPVHHGAPSPRLVLSVPTWTTAVPGADAALSAILERHAALLADSIPEVEEFIDRVRRHVAEGLPDGAPSVQTVAQGLGMSGRSLQRRLQEEGHSFSALVDEVRLRLARLHVAQPDASLAETAFLLGFSEQSAFTRAFRRWTGETPGAWRRRERS
jgi:AraC-like DNA-binding protein